MSSVIFILMTTLSSLNISTTVTSLEVNITNIKAVKGDLYISVYNKEENFPKDKLHYKKIKLKVKQSSIKYTFKDLPKGDYAIVIFHDKNSDNEFNTNLFGMPTEGYGFSKNFKSKFSAPSFKDLKFTLKDKYTSTIKLIN